MKRIAIFAHYDERDEVKPYIVHHLGALAAECDRIDFVSHANLSKAELDKAAVHCERTLTKENVGFDFGMWQHALEGIDLSAFDELVLTNSSIYGPLSSLKPMFEKMSTAACDFWAVTDNHEIQWHLQSYFLTFKRRVFDSAEFNRFWASVLPYRNKWQVIRSYEIGLTDFLVQSGFEAAAYLPSDALFPEGPMRLLHRHKRKNPTCYHALRLIERGMPYVKVELLRDNPAKVDLAPVYEALERRGYDKRLIDVRAPTGAASR
jgi:rhamnosyltransferase